MFIILYAVLSAIIVYVAVHLTISKNFRIGPPWPDDTEKTKSQDGKERSLCCH